MNRSKKPRQLMVKRKIVIMVLVAILVLMAVLLISTVAHSETSIPDATKNFYVNDFGEVFNADQEQEMMDRAVNLAYKPEGVQVVVTTVKSLNGLSVEDYANLMYNKYGIGKDDKGILILLSIQERKVRIEVGYGLESVINDSKAGNYIRDYALDYLKNNQFDLGLMALQKAVVTDLDAHFEKARVTATPKVRPTDVPVTQSSAAESKQITRSNNDEVRLSKTKENDYGVFAALGLAAAIIFIIGFITQTIKLRRSEKNRDFESKEYDKKLTSRDSTIQSLRLDMLKQENALDKQKESYGKLKEKYNHLNDRFERAKKLNKNLDKEIDAMIQKEIDDKNREIAAEFDNSFGSLATEDLLKKYFEQGPKGWSSFNEKYQRALTSYNALTSEQKHYVKTDMNEVNAHYKAGKLQKSKEDADALNKELKTCTKNLSGTETNLQTFEKLQKQYHGMDEQTQGFVSLALIQALGTLKNKAESEKRQRIAEEERRRREEEERRRRRRQQEEEEERRRQSYYSSSYDSGGSFGGFGGSSGGGGASSSF